MDIPHFVYPLVGGDLSCFYVLAIMNSAVINFCIQVFGRTILCVCVFLVYTYRGMQLLGPMVTLCLSF